MLLGGKPGIGKTITSPAVGPVYCPGRRALRRGIALLRARRGSRCLTRPPACELGVLILATTPGGKPAGAGGAPGAHPRRRRRCDHVREALDSDPLLDEAQRRSPPTPTASCRHRVGGAHRRQRHRDVTGVRRRRSHCSSTTSEGAGLPGRIARGEQAGHVIESLKQLALDQRLAVVAVAAADHVGLEARRLHPPPPRIDRARLRGRRDLMLNEKRAWFPSPSGLLPDPGRGVPPPGRVLGGEEPQRAPGRPPGVREGLRPLPLPSARPPGRRALWTEGSVELCLQDVSWSAGRARHRTAIRLRSPLLASCDGRFSSRESPLCAANANHTPHHFETESTVIAASAHPTTWPDRLRRPSASPRYTVNGECRRSYAPPLPTDAAPTNGRAGRATDGVGVRRPPAPTRQNRPSPRRPETPRHHPPSRRRHHRDDGADAARAATPSPGTDGEPPTTTPPDTVAAEPSPPVDQPATSPDPGHHRAAPADHTPVPALLKPRTPGHRAAVRTIRR